MRTIGREEIKRRIDAQELMTLVEALPERYYKAERLPGAINIPHDEVRSCAENELPDKDATIIVYCANIKCRNSHIAAQSLNTLGYRNVFVYAEGKEDWKAAGYPLVPAHAALKASIE